MANAAKIRETIDAIRANPHRFDMSTFGAGDVNPDAASWHDCGTVACLAGWRCLLDGLRPAVCPCGCGKAAASYRGPTGEPVSASEWAAQTLELTDEEVGVLFYAEAVTDIDVLAALAEEIIAGRIPGRCGDCEGDGCDVCGQSGYRLRLPVTRRA